MNVVALYALGSVVLVSIVSFVGIFTLSMSKAFLKKSVSFLVALSIGALLGDAFLQLIPTALEESKSATLASLLVLLGIFLFFLIEKFLHWHHGIHGSKEHYKEHCDMPNDKTKKSQAKLPLGKLILVSDGIHNFIDGIVIGASYLISIEVGVATTIAVIMHEIPQEMGDIGVIIHAGYTRVRALILNFFSALLAVAGTVLALVIGSSSQDLIIWILPIAAGSFIYIASSDLIPELHNETSTKESIIQILAILIGVAIMYLLLFLE